MEKITKRNMYAALINFALTDAMTFTNADGIDVTVTADDLKAFAENEIALLDKKAAKAKENAAKKKTEVDELTIAIKNVLGDEFETIADIAARVEADEVTAAKCAYRLNKLVEMGVAEKDDMKLAAGDGKKARTVKAYRMVQEQCVADEE